MNPRVHMCWPAVLLALSVLLGAVLCGASVHADDFLHVTEIRVDRPTLHAIGIQVLIVGDDDFDSRMNMRARPIGAPEWRDAPPLFRVRPEYISAPGRAAVSAQFAGSIFDLQADTSYEVELRIVDPDAAVPVPTQRISVRTRAVPMAEAPEPCVVRVANAEQLQKALSKAHAGDVIELAPGLYRGSFSIQASGTQLRPIVVRGVSQTATILDGNGCTDCNVLEVSGSFVHVEHMTIRNAARGMRFQGPNTTANVARALRISDVVHGIGSRTPQTDFYICDNDINGRLSWPWPLAANARGRWDDRGIDVNGDGHVICHNRIRGFGDAVVNQTAFARSWDVYGNDILDGQDGTELDRSTGNARFWGNRWTNLMAAISLQPIYGGPAYVLRNVGYNIADEQLKLKSLGGDDLPSGVLIWHNTFVSPRRALNLQTPITQFHFNVQNNLFVGPASAPGRAVDWTATVVDAVFDYNGYYPDTGFNFGTADGVRRIFTTLAQAAKAGVEVHGVALAQPIFENAVLAPEGDGSLQREPMASFALAAESQAVNHGMYLPGINQRAPGGPDLGAWERGCRPPFYGPRPREMQHKLLAVVDCAAANATSGGVAVGSNGLMASEFRGTRLRYEGSGVLETMSNWLLAGGCACRVVLGVPGWVVTLVAFSLVVAAFVMYMRRRARMREHRRAHRRSRRRSRSRNGAGTPAAQLRSNPRSRANRRR